MAFIVKKEIHGNEYYYLVERHRDKATGKVKSKTLGYLGKNKKQAKQKMKEMLSKEKSNGEIVKKEVIGVKELQKPVQTMQKQVQKPITIEDLAAFCKRKGFVFQSSDIYGGFAGFWDFGPLGAVLFDNITKDWTNFFVQQKENMVSINASVISHPRTWKASGHLESFSDIGVVCKKCGKATKIDKSELGKIKCECGGEYESQGEFNLLFKTKVGALDAEDAYLRGETAQAMFMDFKLIQENSRLQLPFGIAQIGKCFRNEIAPRDFLFRSREFTIGEFEFFINPDETKCDLLTKEHLNLKFRFLDAETTISDMLKLKRLDEWHAYWLAEQIMWFYSLGLNKIKVREHTKDELSHYSSATFDIDYAYPFGSREVAGIANRGQYDLNQHIKESRQKLDIFDEKTKQKVIPRVIEPTFGIDRVFLAVLVNGYLYDEQRQNIVLKIPSKLSPIKAAVFPLVKIDKKLVKISKEIYKNLKKYWSVFYDEGGSIGRRYARQDEIGTPFCITIDGDSAKNKDVTIRNRDDTKQIRVKIKDLSDILKKLISNGIKFEKAGRLIN